MKSELYHLQTTSWSDVLSKNHIYKLQLSLKKDKMIFFFYIQASAIGNVHKIKSKELQNILRIKGIKRGNGIETQGNDEHSSKFLEHRVVMEMLQTDTNVWGMLKGLKNVKNKIKLPHFLVYCSSQEPPLLWSSPGLCCHLWNLTSERRERCCHTRSSRVDKANNGKWLHPLKEVHPLTDSWMVLKDKNRQPLIHWYKVTSSMLSLSPNGHHFWGKTL